MLRRTAEGSEVFGIAAPSRQCRAGAGSRAIELGKPSAEIQPGL